MLHLASSSSESWLRGALADVDLVLLDHAHCEKKAASTALSLAFRYQEQAALVAPLAELAREELDHFLQVLALLSARGVPFRRLHPAPYGARLHEAVRKPDPGHLLDTLLVCALIEARSCERMTLLAEHLPDPEIAGLYRGLLACEARHFHSYVEMATALFPRDEVRARLQQLSAHEARVLEQPCAELRLHSS